MKQFLLWVTGAPSHWGTLGRNGEHSPEFSHLRDAKLRCLFFKLVEVAPGGINSLALSTCPAQLSTAMQTKQHSQWCCKQPEAVEADPERCGRASVSATCNKRRSVSLIIKYMQIKLTMKLYFDILLIF